MGDGTLRDQIGAELSRLDVDTSQVSVEVREGQVILTGSVRTWFETDEVGRAVWSVPGVKDVDNRLVFTEGGASAEVENIP